MNNPILILCIYMGKSIRIQRLKEHVCLLVKYVTTKLCLTVLFFDYRKHRDLEGHENADYSSTGEF